jgi:hypothetical protein
MALTSFAFRGHCIAEARDGATDHEHEHEHEHKHEHMNKFSSTCCHSFV